MSVNVLPDHIPIHQMHAVSVEAKSGVPNPYEQPLGARI